MLYKNCLFIEVYKAIITHMYYFNTIGCEYDVITVQNEGTIICNNNIPKNL